MGCCTDCCCIFADFDTDKLSEYRSFEGITLSLILKLDLNVSLVKSILLGGCDVTEILLLSFCKRLNRSSKLLISSTYSLTSNGLSIFAILNKFSPVSFAKPKYPSS